MILTQTAAIFVDAYRELHARKLFWVTMVVSVVLVAAFATVGITDKGPTVLWWTLPLEQLSTKIVPAELFYKFLFAQLAIPLWLSWGAVILALVSTASMIPEFVTGGSIELSLSKPIGRLRLLLTKYLAALVFVALQAVVFVGGWFFLIGIRGGSWEPRLLLAVPIVLLVFSSVYCVCALVGMLTRSTIAALIAAMIFWLIVFMVHTTETIFLQLKVTNELRQERISAFIESIAAKRLRQAEQAASEGRTVDAAVAAADQAALDRRQSQLDEAIANAKTLNRVHAIMYGVKTVLPKTSETVGLLQRNLLSPEDAERFIPSNTDDVQTRRGDDVRINQREQVRRIDRAQRERTLGWVLGTSLAFQAAIFGLMAWIFTRRDF